MNGTLYERINYLTDRPFISGTYITEYDISKANINVLYSYNLISESFYNQLSNIDKETREIYIGKQIQREQNPKDIKDKGRTYNAIRDGILLAKRKLFEANNILDSEVIRIANDAVYVERPILLNNTSFDLNNNQRYVTFNTKNTYTSYMKLVNVLLFFSSNNDEYNIDIKGISKELIPLHEPFITFICDLMYYAERMDKKVVIFKFEEFYQKYLRKELPMEFYREFNSSSGYKIKGSRYIGRFIDKNYFDKIDISFNNYLLREIYSYILSK